ncbi:DUF6526 family protein [Paenibacillus sp. YYML68]|uniref:DUF6526 family protein n=1 Tax=Paenibacillus sp. YYML68 TaxID=2909250 RepID=UPI0024909227|nr:DUF6526 family protein [Paenibacillus sp. YYML68]
MSTSTAQNYSNHRKLDPPYHYVLAPVSLIVLIASIMNVFMNGMSLHTLIVLGLALAVSLIAALVRLYATKLQDRIIRHEESFRHYRLTGLLLDGRLTSGQIIALRFASDEEYPALCAKAAEAGMKPDEIKRSIAQWRADHHRV